MRNFTIYFLFRRFALENIFIRFCIANKLFFFKKKKIRNFYARMLQIVKRVCMYFYLKIFLHLQIIHEFINFFKFGTKGILPVSSVSSVLEKLRHLFQ